MKLITAICRILVGGLFIFSGFIKSNDPKGFGIKLEEYFEVFAADVAPDQDSIVLSMKDNQGNSKVETIHLMHFDSAKTIAFNSSTPRKVAFGNADSATGKQDSVYKVDAYVLVDGQVKYQTDYTFSDSSDKVNYTVRAKVANDSSFHKTYTFGLKKIEASNSLDVSKYIKSESWLVGFFKGLKPYAVLISIIICVLEIMLGFAILIGWRPSFVSWMLLLMIVFFTILTWYSYTYNKVTDCGCFGDFIKLTPYQSFMKDVILLVLILVIFIRRKHIKPLFSAGFGLKSVVVVTLAATAFAVYSDRYLPLIDFLPYEEGNDILALMTPPAGARDKDSMSFAFVYETNGKKDTFTMSELSKKPADAKFVERVDVVVVPANWHSPIHDFNFAGRPDSDVNPKDSLLHQKGYKLIIISKSLEKSNQDAWKDIVELSKQLTDKDKLPIYAFTASSFEEADKFTTEQQAPYKFYNGDETLLKTMIRSNPGVILMKDAVIVRKWSSHNIPTYERVKKRMK